MPVGLLHTIIRAFGSCVTERLPGQQSSGLSRLVVQFVSRYCFLAHVPTYFISRLAYGLYCVCLSNMPLYHESLPGRLMLCASNTDSSCCQDRLRHLAHTGTNMLVSKAALHANCAE